MKNFIKINNPEYFILLFFGYIYYIFVLFDNHISLNFNYQYYLYDYNFGFIKLGVIGSICNLLFLKVSESTFVLAVTAILFLLAISIVKIIDYINFKIYFKNNFFGYFLISLLVICPAFLKNLWYDLERLDISPLVLLIYEGFFLLWLPTYFVCWFIRTDMVFTKSVKLIFIVFIFLSFLLLFIVNHYGKLNVSVSIFQTYLKSKYNDIIYFESSFITESLYKQIYSSIILNFTHVKFWFLGIINLLSIVYIIVLYCILLDINYRIIYLPTILSFMMFFVGSDALRWFSNMCFSLYLLLICILITKKYCIKDREIIDKSFTNHIYFLIFILITMMPLKNLGVLWW